MLLTETTVLCSENNTKPINAQGKQNKELLIIKAGGTYSYHQALKH
jgi:hypothetical protein